MEENKPIHQPEDEQNKMPSSSGKENLPNNEQELNTTSTGETIVPGETIAATEQPATINYQSEKKDMEVHHHAHTPRKKWTHYFWEFFMLFLAVTLGFLVENKREHYIEHQRAKVYAKSMIKNLETDTIELKQIINRGKFASDYLDSFIVLLSKQELQNIPTGKLYWYGIWGGYLRGFEPNDATYQQMKNSGSLRYFNSPELEQLIGEYDQVLRAMKALNEVERPLYLEVRKARARLFDFRYNNDANKIIQSAVYNEYNPNAIDSFININPPLLNTDKILFNEYAELCRSRNLRTQLKNAGNALDLATAIIDLLKKEYHLK
ncbi:MAG: hypothetical protein IPF69_02890 [Chitinophagaceae bacterium]|jgi:hypothetical protein|nr:hypothetical protein [Chitinophagaceae bacterium]MBK9660535.1 hypothetical protein [Chitinophagaceae bacterium]HQW44969.1 hypothetical protein [Chitinophagaceae bacterium]